MENKQESTYFQWKLWDDENTAKFFPLGLQGCCKDMVIKQIANPGDSLIIQIIWKIRFINCCVKSLPHHYVKNVLDAVLEDKLYTELQLQGLEVVHVSTSGVNNHKSQQNQSQNVTGHSTCHKMQREIKARHEKLQGLFYISEDEL